ncbi:segregation/condensation protein A [Mycoplasmopsis felis]|uniref:segregation/condensation protein A n=1 Tax=Mycoplasmopsis felis TaxID=33923 RepID=UPI002AFFE3D0|nr:segregation/condensation protein A [Mycoplasmopsis felis]WQQ03467.1 segregation/condensation protein A [Mycoplasmopsis felis]
MGKLNLNYTYEHTFKLNDFNGPLDLLLELIKNKKIHIKDVNLIELATQYIQIIDEIKEMEIDIAGEYLVMAATLINLKTKMMLQEPGEINEEIEEEKKLFIQDLIEYEHFKKIREALKTFQNDRNDIFIKKPSSYDEYIVDEDNSKLDGHSSSLKLINVLRKMFERVYAQNLRQTKIEKFNLTPSDQFPFIIELLKNNEIVTFEMVFNQPSLNHFAITLIALLDLSRQQILKIKQEGEYGDITITKGENFNERNS